MTADGATVYMRDSRNRNTGALVAIDLASDKATVLGGSDKARRRGDASRSAHRRRRGLQRQLPEERVDAGRKRAEGRHRVPQPRGARRVERDQPIARQAPVDGDGRPRERARHVLPLRPPGEEAHQALHDAARARRQAARVDASGRDQGARRPDARRLSLAAAGDGQGRQRPSRQAAADGAERARRSVGARRVRLSPASTSGSPIAATRCSRSTTADRAASARTS